MPHRGQSSCLMSHNQGTLQGVRHNWTHHVTTDSWSWPPPHHSPVDYDHMEYETVTIKCSLEHHVLFLFLPRSGFKKSCPFSQNRTCLDFPISPSAGRNKLGVSPPPLPPGPSGSINVIIKPVYIDMIIMSCQGEHSLHGGTSICEHFITLPMWPSCFES